MELGLAAVHTQMQAPRLSPNPCTYAGERSVCASEGAQLREFRWMCTCTALRAHAHTSRYISVCVHTHACGRQGICVTRAPVGSCDVYVSVCAHACMCAHVYVVCVCMSACTFLCGKVAALHRCVHVHPCLCGVLRGGLSQHTHHLSSPV